MFILFMFGFEGKVTHLDTFIVNECMVANFVYEISYNMVHHSYPFSAVVFDTDCSHVYNLQLFCFWRLICLNKINSVT